MIKKILSTSVVLLSVTLLSSAPLSAADNLNEMLDEGGWSDIIGTWVDADTQGSVATTTYAWKIQDRVIEVTSKAAGTESVALIGVNARTEEVFHMGADSNGASFIGKWDVDADGDAVLGLLYTDGEGTQGSVSIRQRLLDKDTIIVTIELESPVEIKMIRK